MISQEQITFWMHCVYRAVFGLKFLESVKEVQMLCGRLNLKHLPEMSKLQCLYGV